MGGMGCIGGIGCGAEAAAPPAPGAELVVTGLVAVEAVGDVGANPALHVPVAAPVKFPLDLDPANSASRAVFITFSGAIPGVVLFAFA